MTTNPLFCWSYALQMEPQQITDPAARLIAILQAGLDVAEKSLSVCSEKDDRKVMINLLTQSLSLCETQLWLSLDGGRTYTMRITPSMDPNTTIFLSTVPSTPTKCKPNKGLNMKTRGLISVTLFLVALSLLTEAVADTGYSARLISPTAGQVLYPGQKVRVEWEATLPNIKAGGCETELVLSLDGGSTFNTYITPPLDPKAKYFYWTVPNTPTNAAVLDIRFGCEVFYPESRSRQIASPFVIMPTAGQFY